MREKLYRFMQGRYGVDQLNKCILGVALVCIVLSLFFRNRGVDFFYLIGFALIIYGYFRMLSKNHQKRYAENQLYLKNTQGIRKWFASQKNMATQRKTHHIYKCPSCKQKIRVPKGKGKIAVRCPKCQTEFIKVS